jgi:putative chitinase
MSIKLEKLKGVVPDSVIAEIPGVISRFRIDTPLRLSHFLAQCGHESNGFKATVENLNYSAERLLQIFPKYFKTAEIANNYARNQERIANRVYASRMGNGPESSGDGWKYRGRGYIQLTGKNNYAAFDAFVDDAIIENPDLVSTKYPLLSAGWFWHKNKLNEIADLGFSPQVVESITRKVNGGTHGLSDRLNRFNQIYNLLK